MATQKNIKLTSNIILILSFALIGLKYLAFWLEGFTMVKYLFDICGRMAVVILIEHQP